MKTDFNSLTATELGRAFGVSRQAVSAWRCCPRNPDRTYALPEVIRWRMEQQRLDWAVDPGLGGSDSPALERYRLAKAGLAELDLAQREGRLVDMAELNAYLRRASAHLRRFGEVLARRYPDLAIEYNEALAEMLTNLRIDPETAAEAAKETNHE